MKCPARPAFALPRKKWFLMRDLYDKIAAGGRSSGNSALRLFESNDLNALGAIADLAQQKQVYLDG